METAIVAVHERVARKAAAARYHEFVAQIGAPALDHDGTTFLAALQKQIAQSRQALEWETSTGPDLVGRVQVVVPWVDARPSAEQLKAAVTLLDAARDRAAERALTARLAGIGEQIDTELRQQGTSPLWLTLRTAFDHRGTKAWDDTLAEAARLIALRAPLNRRDELLTRVRSAAPRWAQLLRDQRGDIQSCGNPDDLATVWRWRQAQTWLEDLHGRGDVMVVQQQVIAAMAQSRRLVLEIATGGARLGVHRNLRDDQRRALIGWLQASAHHQLL